MPRKPKFKIKPLRYYLVDFSDLREPLLVRKHYLTIAQAEEVRDKYFSKNFKVLTYKECLEHNIKANLYKDRDKRAKAHLKYNYPPELTTRREKLVWRVNERAKMKNQIKDKLTRKKVVDIIGDEEKFIRRCSRGYFLQRAFQKPPKGFKEICKKIQGVGQITQTCHILSILHRYYEVMNYTHAEVAIKLQKVYSNKIFLYTLENRKKRKHWKDPKAYLELEPIGYILVEDFVAQGNSIEPTYAYLISLDGKYIYPEKFWHSANYREAKTYSYKASELYGVRGVTKLQLPSVIY